MGRWARGQTDSVQFVYFSTTSLSCPLHHRSTDGSNYQSTNRRSCRQPTFYKITLLPCFSDFCFSFLYLLPHKCVGTFQLADIWANVLGLSRATFVQPFLLDLISFENKQKQSIPTLKGEPAFLVFSSSCNHRSLLCVNFQQFGWSNWAHVIQLLRVFTAN